MAQASKKDQIADSALAIFLNNGFKGTSIDLLVKVSAVSKPTVYNHFPDKAALLDYVIDKWLQTATVPTIQAATEVEFARLLSYDFFTDETVKMFALMIGEGRRFVKSRQKFLAVFSAIWRGEVDRWADQHQFDNEHMQMLFSHQLLLQLTQVEVA